MSDIIITVTDKGISVNGTAINEENYVQVFKDAGMTLQDCIYVISALDKLKRKKNKLRRQM